VTDQLSGAVFILRTEHLSRARTLAVETHGTTTAVVVIFTVGCGRHASVLALVVRVDVARFSLGAVVVALAHHLPGRHAFAAHAQLALGAIVIDIAGARGDALVLAYVLGIHLALLAGRALVVGHALHGPLALAFAAEACFTVLTVGVFEAVHVGDALVVAGVVVVHLADGAQGCLAVVVVFAQDYAGIDALSIHAGLARTAISGGFALHAGGAHVVALVVGIDVTGFVPLAAVIIEALQSGAQALAPNAQLALQAILVDVARS